MTKKLLLALVCLLGAPLTLQAQNWTTVSATNITDLNQNKLAVGQLCFLATDQNDNPISFQVGGGGQVLKRAFCSGVTSGALAAALTVPNPAVSVPSGIYYRVTVRDTTTGQEVLRYPGVTFSGATFNFDLYAPANVGQLAPLSGNAVSGNLSVSGNLNVTGTLNAALASPFTVSGVSETIGPDNGRFGAQAFRIQPTAANSQATLTLMPSGTGNASELRLYNSSDPLNTGTLELSLTGTTVSMFPVGFGTGVAPNLLDTSGFPTFKANKVLIGGDAVLSASPRMIWAVNFTGAVPASSTLSRSILDKPITVTRFMVVMNSGALSGCTTAPVFSITDGTNTASCSVANATSSCDSGSISVNLAAAVLVPVNVNAFAGCAAVNNAEITIQYKMQ